MSGEGDVTSLIEVLRHWLNGLGLNMKYFNEVAGDDSAPNLARRLATGVEIYVTHGTDFLPGRLRTLGLIDDVIVMIIGASIIQSQLPQNRREYYAKKYPLIGNIDDSIHTLRSALAITFDRIRQYVEGLVHKKYGRYSTGEVANDTNLRMQLFDETMEHIANVAPDPKSVDRNLKLLPSLDKLQNLLPKPDDED